MPGFFDALGDALRGRRNSENTSTQAGTSEVNTGRRVGASTQTEAPVEPEPPLAQGAFATRYGVARGLVLPSLSGAATKASVLQAAAQKGIFASATPERLSEAATRAEALTMAMRAFGRAPLDIGLVKRVFKDVSISHWAAGSIYGATALGIVGGFEDETFKPDEALEASHLGAILMRAASPPGKPTRFDPRVEWGERPTLDGATLDGAANAKSLDAEALGGTRDATGDEASRVGDTNRIVDTLKAGSSKRYKPKRDLTYCNVFAHDFAWLMGAFVPRVWWTADAVKTYEKTGEFPEPVYGKNVVEMTANGIHDWFVTWGHRYGWSKVGGVDPSALTAGQSLANAGRVVIVVGDTGKSTPGHITAMVPETETSKAKRNDEGQVTAAHQSQAGANPVTRGASDWYDAAKYKGGKATWVHS